MVEIKCPSTTKTVTNYIKDGVISNKCKAQIQLHMHMFEKRRGIFCVADPSFEVNNTITFQYIDYDEEFIVNIMTAAEEFWKNHIFPMLFNSIESNA